jgi:hypothetical protein
VVGRSPAPTTATRKLVPKSISTRLCPPADACGDPRSHAAHRPHVSLGSARGAPPARAVGGTGRAFLIVGVEGVQREEPVAVGVPDRQAAAHATQRTLAPETAVYVCVRVLCVSCGVGVCMPRHITHL